MACELRRRNVENRGVKERPAMIGKAITWKYFGKGQSNVPSQAGFAAQLAITIIEVLWRLSVFLGTNGMFNPNL